MMQIARAAGYGTWLALGVPAAWAGGAHGLAADAARANIQAAFAPWDNVEQTIVDALGGARHRILMQAYLFTSRTIAAALLEAHRRGVDVRILLDAEQVAKGNATVAAELAGAGIPVWLETRYQNAHNKILIIDPDSAAATVITGSYNFTWAANHHNAENILVVRRHPELVARFAMNWERHRQAATSYKP